MRVGRHRPLATAGSAEPGKKAGPRPVMRQPAVRELGRLRRPRRRLRAGLVQLLCVLAGLGLGLLLPRISTGPSVASTRVTEALVTIGFGTLGLVSVIFSLLFLVVQWAFGSLSPRLNLFRDDPIVWRTFGVSVGVFVFSVTAALVIANDSQVSVIVPAVEVAAVLLAIALMRVLQVRAFTSIQLAPTLAAIATEGRGILDSRRIRSGPSGPRPSVLGRLPADQPGRSHRVRCPLSHGAAAGTGLAYQPAEYGAATAPAVNRMAASARRRSHGRQLPGDLARHRRERPCLSSASFLLSGSFLPVTAPLRHPGLDTQSDCDDHKHTEHGLRTGVPNALRDLRATALTGRAPD